MVEHRERIWKEREVVTTNLSLNPRLYRWLGYRLDQWFGVVLDLDVVELEWLLWCLVIPIVF